MVEADIDDGEGFEKGVVDAVDETGIDVYEGDGGVFDGDFDGFDKGGEEDRGGLEIALVDLALRLEVQVSGKFAETLRTAEEDIRCGRLRQAEK